ncbi:hypothetical protein BJY59DRAFT_42641 [Rhodotorula toruloides]
MYFCTTTAHPHHFAPLCVPHPLTCPPLARKLAFKQLSWSIDRSYRHCSWSSGSRETFPASRAATPRIGPRDDRVFHKGLLPHPSLPRARRTPSATLATPLREFLLQLLVQLCSEGQLAPLRLLLGVEELVELEAGPRQVLVALVDDQTAHRRVQVILRVFRLALVLRLALVFPPTSSTSSSSLPASSLIDQLDSAARVAKRRVVASWIETWGTGLSSSCGSPDVVSGFVMRRCMTSSLIRVRLIERETHRRQTHIDVLPNLAQVTFEGLQPGILRGSELRCMLLHGGRLALRLAGHAEQEKTRKGARRE